MPEEGIEKTKLSGYNDKMEREAPQLVTVLKDIKGGLDDLRAKIQVLTSKIRPIDKKLQYQIQKLTRLTGNSMEDVGSDDKKPDATREADDSLKLRPNPGMLMNKVTPDDGDGKYRPPKIAPASMDETKTSKQERNVSRKEKQAFRQALQSEYARDLMNDLEGRPEEVREVVGTEDRDVTRYKAKMEDRARREEELFTRAPLTSMEKKKLKHMRKSRNGLLGLADSFYDDIKSLPLEEGVGGQTTSFMDSNGGERKLKRHKRRH